MRQSIGVALFLVALAFSPGASADGVIAGSIRAEVGLERRDTAEAGAYGSRRYKFLDKVDYEAMGDFVVSIADVERFPAPDGPRPQAMVTQRNGAFIPSVLPVVAGTEVSWPNRDDIFHNVFSISEAQPFDLGYYKSEDDPKRIVFRKLGRVDVFCSIHSEMNCVVLVMPNPWFATSDRRGRFRIEGVPAGEYRLKAWHARLPAKYVDVTVGEGTETEVEIVMGLADLPKIP